MSGGSGTPAVFIRGRRHHGPYAVATLSAGVRASGARAKLLRA
jgi:hypothetical protein